jgi:molecular chaperone GrpE (heat shock protein)
MADMIALKKEYMSGVKTSELSEKYNVPYTQLTQQITRENWVKKKENFRKKLESKIEDIIESRISKLTDKSLDILENIIDNSDNESNKLKAVSEILDLSGYKKQTLNNNVKNFKETPDIPTEFIMLRNREKNN